MVKMGYEKRVIHYDWHNKPEEKYGYKFKSQAEVKFADYLEILRRGKEIIWWAYEYKKFYCGHKWGKDRYYTPDFISYNGEEEIIYYEVKVYLRQKDVSRFRFLRQAYSDVVINLVLPRKQKSIKQKRLLTNTMKYVNRVMYMNELI